MSGESFAKVKFEVNSPTAWRAFTKATDGWSTVITKKGETSGSGSLIVTENETVVPRSMYIYVQSVEFPTLKDSILLTQSARPLKLEIISPTNKKSCLMVRNHNSYSLSMETESGRLKTRRMG